MSETTLSADPESDLDETLPYVIDDVYRVEFTGDEAIEILSETEEEVAEDRELWTHVYHADREPAPYAVSETDEDEPIPVQEPQLEIQEPVLI